MGVRLREPEHVLRHVADAAVDQPLDGRTRVVAAVEQPLADRRELVAALA